MEGQEWSGTVSKMPSKKDAQAVPEYRDLMRSIDAEEVFVRPDGSIEFQI